MVKAGALLTLVGLFMVYSAFVYTEGTEVAGASSLSSPASSRGKLLFQKYNCTACHQLYGLGGYLGPDLTTVISQKGKGELYAKAILKTGTQRMPDFRLNDREVEDIVAFLKYVDATANK